MIIEDLDYYKTSANYTSKLSGIDNPRDFYIDSEWWYGYPVQDFDYQFNSWGFRGPEYTQYIGKPINICIGDSFTVNIGGPIEHSWSSQLTERFVIPTINLGMDGAGNDSIKLVYDRACEIFDVQNTFVMYSFFHRRLKNNEFIHVGCLDDKENINYFEKNMIQDAIYTFLPSWCWNENELNYLQSKHKNNLYNLFNSNSITSTPISKKLYNDYKGNDWVSYDEFTKGIINEAMQDDEIFVNYIKNRCDNVNRDSYHLNKLANQIVADFLWSQYNAT